jgi:hypothetical protein
MSYEHARRKFKLHGLPSISARSIPDGEYAERAWFVNIVRSTLPRSALQDRRNVRSGCSVRRRAPTLGASSIRVASSALHSLPALAAHFHLGSRWTLRSAPRRSLAATVTETVTLSRDMRESSRIATPSPASPPREAMLWALGPGVCDVGCEGWPKRWEMS